MTQIDPKRAIPRDEQERTSKIFVGGVSQEATEADFKNFFMQFGRVLDATLMMDKDTGRPRGFGFVTFDSEAAVDRTLERPLEILGKYIEVKKAQPRGNLRGNEDNGNNNNNGGGGGFKKQGFGGQQGGFDPSQQGGMQQGGPAGMGGNNMSPAMMAQYWQRMQQYFQMMQQQLATSMGGGGNPMMGGAGGMNPQMMQQMMAMQQGMGQGKSCSRLSYLRSRLLTSISYRRHEPSHDAANATNAAADAARWWWQWWPRKLR
jgi:RNA-binding protein Musashi